MIGNTLFSNSVEFKADLVTAAPDVYQVALASDAEFILLASDGLWDYMNRLAGSLSVFLAYCVLSEVRRNNRPSIF